MVSGTIGSSLAGSVVKRLLFKLFLLAHLPDFCAKLEGVRRFTAHDLRSTARSHLAALGVPVLIPEDYVPDLDLRLGLYRRLSALTTKVELEGFAAELIDRFGPVPKEVNTLLLIVRIKAMCKRNW